MPGFLAADRPDGSPTVANHGMGDAFDRRVKVPVEGRILHACEIEEAQHIAEMRRTTVPEYRFEWEGPTLSVGLSVGPVPLDGHFDSPGNALMETDLAGHETTRQGRNGIVERTRMPGN